MSPDANEAYFGTKEILLEKQGTLGPLQIKDYHGPFADSSAIIGRLNRDRIDGVLAYKSEQEHYKGDLVFSNKCFDITKASLEHLKHVDTNLFQAGKIYLDSLEKWAVGADISPNEAFLLQNEAVGGCQTVLVRAEDGGAFMGHTEEWYMEDDELREVKITPEWSNFILPGQDTPKQTFTGYPFCLPGTTFGISNGRFQALDSLELKPSKKPAMPANVAAWLCWYLAGEIDAVEIIKHLEPFGDGYALNEIYMQHGKVHGHTIEFARNKVAVRHLPEEPLSSIIETNMISDQAMAQTVGRKFEPRESDKVYYDRLSRTHTKVRDAWKKRFKRPGQHPSMTLAALKREFGLIPTTRGKGFGEIPQDYTYATFFAKVGLESYEAEVVAGPIVPNEEARSSRLIITNSI